MKDFELVSFLKEIPLFSRADPLLLQKALHTDNAHILSATAEQTLDPRFSHALGVVLTGELQIQTTDAEKKLSLKIVRAGQVFGAATLFLPQNPPPTVLVALCDTEVLFLEHGAVRELLGKDPEFLDAYLSLLADRVYFLNQKIRCFTAGSVERRVAIWLAENAAKSPVTAATLTGLAELLDVGRASLYRALDKLENDGLILRNGRELCVPCADKLLQKYHS